MKMWLLGLAMAAAIGSSSAQAQRVQTLQPGHYADWSAHRQPQGAVYRTGDLRLTIRNEPDPELADLTRPALTVSMPGAEPVKLYGADTLAEQDHRVSIGRWSADGTPFVFFQSFSGGAHCCTSWQLVVPQQGRLVSYDLGEWDSGYEDQVPKDEDGDGVVDFVQRDNSFLYTFSSYAGSFAPPAILNIVGGQVTDVSTRPGFRRFYEEFIPDARAACGSGEADRNGACAGYVAAAARLGRFDEAWADMLQHYDRNADWPLPSGCRVATGSTGECPDDQKIEYDSFPDSLRNFLEEEHYVAKRG